MPQFLPAKEEGLKKRTRRRRKGSKKWEEPKAEKRKDLSPQFRKKNKIGKVGGGKVESSLPFSPFWTPLTPVGKRRRDRGRREGNSTFHLPLFYTHTIGIGDPSPVLTVACHANEEVGGKLHTAAFLQLPPSRSLISAYLHSGRRR